MSDIQPLKEDVVHAGTIEDPIPQKLIFVKKDGTGAKKVYTLGMGGTTGGSDVNVSPATDIVTGIVKLTDNPTVDAPAAVGSVAMTPNGVKTAIETAKEEINEGIKDIVDGAIQDKIDNGEIGGITDPEDLYVVKPVITSPTQSASGVNTFVTVIGTPYRNVFEDDLRTNRQFQIADNIEFTSPKVDQYVNADQLTLTEQLEGNKAYFVRIRDISTAGYSSLWSDVIKFTTAEGQIVNTPTITLKGYNNSPTDILSGLTIEGSAFSVNTGEDTHRATSWSITKKDALTRNAIWQSIEDTVNLTQAVVPEGTLEQGTSYVLTVIYHGTKASDSSPATVEFTTSNDFGQVNAPTLSVEGSPNTVYETPTLTAGAFSNTRDPDTHEYTDWEILDATGATPVWQALSDDVNKTSIVVGEGYLQENTAYKARVRYYGTKYGWSAYTTVNFSTVAHFSIVNTPTITVQGAPDKILETPMLIGSAFGGTNVTHKSTDWEILLASNNNEVWSSKRDTTNLTSIKVPKGILQVSTGYIFKVRYNANEEVSSEYASATHTTAASFIRYNYIGIPGTKSFGVGLTTEDIYTSVGLINASNNTDEDDFHYGQYCAGKYTEARQNSIDMKWIPKFYIAMLQKNEGTENLSDSELDALLPYVEVTKAQMKEAQRRSPHNAMVVAPSDMFTNEVDANSHGFYLMRGFIDGGKEQEGFFISNYCAMWSGSNLGAEVLKIGVNDRKAFNSPVRGNSNLTTVVGTMFNPSKATNAKGNFISTLEGTYYQCCSVFAWAVISVISLIQGQYATDVSQCTWYDENLSTNYPKGINSSTQDADDPTVTSSVFSDSTGIFDVENVSKTTHNGFNNGVHIVNGWLWQYVIGSWGDGSKLLKRSASIYDITYDNVDNSGASFWEAHSTSNISANWGGTKSSFPDFTSTDKDLFGVYAFGDNSSNNSNEFGTDGIDRVSSAAINIGGYYQNGVYSGIFRRSSAHWTNSNGNEGFRAMAYPRRAGIDYEEGTWTPPTARVLLTANGGGGIPDSQEVVVESGTTFGTAKAKLTKPTKTGYNFSGWA